MQLPDGKYGAILADPPWSFTTWSDKGKDRSPEKHYSCMSIDDIKAMPVQERAASDCVLFLWVYTPLLLEGIDVLKAWGFRYTSIAFIWGKINKNALTPAMSTGYWTRAGGEICLMGTRGKPRRQSAGVRQLILEPRREHSRKPDRIYTDIPQLVGGPYLELFARQSREGWTTWGNERTKFDAE